jgi:hypothetical protein
MELNNKNHISINRYFIILYINIDIKQIIILILIFTLSIIL